MSRRRCQFVALGVKFPLLTKRKLIVATTLAAGAALTTARQDTQPRPSTAPPNIVFVLADDLGYAELGAYGSAASARRASIGWRPKGCDSYGSTPAAAEIEDVILALAKRRKTKR